MQQQWLQWKSDQQAKVNDVLHFQLNNKIQFITEQLVQAMGGLNTTVLLKPDPSIRRQEFRTQNLSGQKSKHASDLNRFFISQE